MKLNNLLAGFADTDLSFEITGIATDSRQVKNDFIFIALANTVQYIPQAIKNGATVILVEQNVNLPGFKNLEGLYFIEIQNLAEKLPEIAARYYHYPAKQLQIIGITGTNGKTSCSQFLAQILENSLVIGTLGWGTNQALIHTGYTTPDVLTLQQILATAVAENKTNVVMEVSSHGIQENRIGQTLFKGVVFTNLSRDHLDYHGSMEAYFQAKLQLFKRPELAFAVINRDDVYADRIIAELAATVTLWTFSQNIFSNCKNNLNASTICCSMTGIQFQAECNGEIVMIRSALYGAFNVENLLAVLTTLLALGFNLTSAANKVANLIPVCGRMQHFGGNPLPTVFVDYAHTPDALEKVLKSIRKHQPRQLIVVFGCGGNRDSGKRPLMGEIACRLADKVIVTNDNPRYETSETIIEMILAGCDKTKVCVMPNRSEAITMAIQHATAEDCVLIAGKGHEDYQEICGIKHLFSDQLIVQEALLKNN